MTARFASVFHALADVKCIRAASRLSGNVGVFFHILLCFFSHPDFQEAPLPDLSVVVVFPHTSCLFFSFEMNNLLDVPMLSRSRFFL